MKKVFLFTLTMVAFATAFAKDVTILTTHQPIPLVALTNNSTDTFTVESVIVHDLNNPSMVVHMYTQSQFSTTRHIGNTGSIIRSSKKLSPTQSLHFEFIFEKKATQQNLEFTFILRDQFNIIHVVCCDGN